jgi:hemin uptake protein HemP
MSSAISNSSFPAAHIRNLQTTSAIPSQELLQGARAVHIVHGDQVYCLQATRLGKLILTKPLPLTQPLTIKPPAVTTV